MNYLGNNTDDGYNAYILDENNMTKIIEFEFDLNDAFKKLKNFSYVNDQNIELLLIILLTIYIL